jgi:hypothetical protein
MPPQLAGRMQILAWTPRRDFAGSKSVTQSLTVGSVAFQKAGADRVTLRADPVRARHGSTGGPARVQAVENRVHLSEPVLRVDDTSILGKRPTATIVVLSTGHRARRKAARLSGYRGQRFSALVHWCGTGRATTTP